MAGGDVTDETFEPYVPKPKAPDTNRQAALLAAATFVGTSRSRYSDDKSNAREIKKMANLLLPWLENHE